MAGNAGWLLTRLCGISVGVACSPAVSTAESGACASSLVSFPGARPFESGGCTSWIDGVRLITVDFDACWTISPAAVSGEGFVPDRVGLTETVVEGAKFKVVSEVPVVGAAGVTALAACTDAGAGVALTRPRLSIQPSPAKTTNSGRAAPSLHGRPASPLIFCDKKVSLEAALKFGSRKRATAGAG